MVLQQSSLDYFHEYLSGYGITPEDWERIAPRIYELDFKKGEFLEREGDIPDKVAFIVSGTCRYFCLSGSCDEKTIVFRGRGTFVSSFTSHLENKRSKLAIQAIEDTNLLYITIKDYEYLLQNSEFWRYFAWKQGMEVIIEKETREIEILAHDAETKYKRFRKQFPGLENRINHYHIASYLGISNVTLSRIRKRLSASGE